MKVALSSNWEFIKNSIQFKTRRKYIPVGLDAASMQRTVLNQILFFVPALLATLA
jgi:hypothetical protein